MPLRPRVRTIKDAEYIIGLMRTETDALGFIPSVAIRSRWVPKGRYIIQRDRRGRRRGYLLHGPACPGQPLIVNQVCINFDHRLQGYAHLAMRELVRRARAAGSTEIRLRCAADLDANQFWLACGFTPTDAFMGGFRRHRVIIAYRLRLPR